jgi:hypothetical protein
MNAFRFKLVCLLAVSVLSLGGSGVTLATNFLTLDIEDGSLSGSTYNENGQSYQPNPSNAAFDSPWISTINARSGSKALGLEVNPNSTGTSRFEWIWRSSVSNTSDYWYGFSFKTDPAKWPNVRVDSTGKGWVIISQWHQPYNDGNHPPAVAIRIRQNTNNQLYFDVRNNSLISNSWESGNYSITHGQWYDVVAHVKYDANGTNGIAQIKIKPSSGSTWTTLGTFTGQVGYSGSVSYAWRTGIYSGRQTAERRLFLDQVKYANTEADARP